MLTPGSIIDDRFEVVALLGEGGMGTVYSVRHREMERTIAVKVLKSSFAGEPERIARFRNEAKAVSSLKHPNIIQVHSVGVSENGQPFMAMEELIGESLSDAIGKHGPLPYKEALPLFIQACAGLQHAHDRDIIHRDIKPSNLVLIDAHGSQTIKIVDFGLAKILGDGQSLTQSGTLIGSVFYLSPELLEGKPADRRSDIYALGCSMYEVLCGSPPFHGETLYETIHLQQSAAPLAVNDVHPTAQIPKSLQHVLNRTLAKQPGDRYKQASELAADLSLILEGKETEPMRAATKFKFPIARKLPKGTLLVALGVAFIYSIAILSGALKSESLTSTNSLAAGNDLAMKAQRALSDRNLEKSLDLIEQALVIYKGHPLEESKACFFKGDVCNRLGSEPLADDFPEKLDSAHREKCQQAFYAFEQSAKYAEAGLQLPNSYAINRQLRAQDVAAIVAMLSEKVKVMNEDIDNRDIDRLYHLYQTEETSFSTDLRACFLTLTKALAVVRLALHSNPEPTLYAVSLRAKLMKERPEWRSQLKDDEETFVTAIKQRYGTAAAARCKAIYRSAN